MNGKKTWFFRGLRDGIPIALGYFTVSFSLGIACTNLHITPFQGGLMSFTNMTSAGQFAGLTTIAAGSGYMVMAILQLVINARYLLMSCALSQRISPETSLPMRFLLGITVTDEIFGVSVGQPGRLEPLYSLGAFCVACPGWTLGTVCGALMGNVLPLRVVSALSVALYGMLIAVFIPQAKRSRVVAGAVAVGMAASWAMSVIPPLAGISNGMKIILLTLLIAGGAAVLFPIPDEEAES